MTFKLVAPVMAASLLLAGCQSGHGGGGMGEKQAGGAPFGGEVGKSLDSADQAYMTQQTNRALESAPTNQTSTWVNPDSQSQVALTPTRTYQRPNGTYCREYSQAITIKNQQQRTTGTACRQPDGSWQAAS